MNGSGLTILSIVHDDAQLPLIDKGLVVLHYIRMVERFEHSDLH